MIIIVFNIFFLHAVVLSDGSNNDWHTLYRTYKWSYNNNEYDNYDSLKILWIIIISNETHHGWTSSWNILIIEYSCSYVYMFICLYVYIRMSPCVSYLHHQCERCKTEVEASGLYLVLQSEVPRRPGQKLLVSENGAEHIFDYKCVQFYLAYPLLGPKTLSLKLSWKYFW